MQGMLGTDQLVLASLAGPVTLIGQPSGSVIPSAAAGAGPERAWRSGISRIAVLRSREDERI